MLWLWWRPAATALIRLLAWEPPYASGAALERQKTKKKKKRKEKERKKEKKRKWERMLLSFLGKHINKEFSSLRPGAYC